MIEICTLAAGEYDRHVPRLAEILMDAVESGAGVSFMWPLARREAESFWDGLKGSIASGRTIQLAAVADGIVAGTVLLQKAWAPNQPHRWEVAKLLVHRDFRRRRIGTMLMIALVEQARGLGCSLITFDAVAHGSAEEFYRSLGFICAGYFPGYALSPAGQHDDAALFYKQL